MDEPIPGKPGDLTPLVPADLRPRSAAEKLLLEKASIGEVADCSELDDKGDNPKQADEWTEKRRIRAALVTWLCTNEQAHKTIRPTGIQVYGADIIGSVDLAFASIPFQLVLQNCRIKEDINLRRAEVSQLDLQDSMVHGVLLDGLVVKNDVFFRNVFVANAGLRLLGAQIGGNLECDGGSFANANGPALNADGIDVKGSVFLRSLEDADERVPFIANGEVNLVRAQIGGNLECNGGTFANANGPALNADSINVKGSIYLRDGFTAKGEVRLIGAPIGGDLDCSGGTFGSKGSRAIDANGIYVKGDVFFRGFGTADGKGFPFIANGEVALDGAQIDGQFSCMGGTFNTPNGIALSANRATVKSSVFLSNGFRADGRIYLEGIQIGGSLHCKGGHFKNATLDLRDASTHTLDDLGLDDNGPTGSELTDWPEGDKDKSTAKEARHYLRLDGFTYGRISSAGRINIDKQLAWLELQPESPFHPQPYMQLAKVLQDSGDNKGAKRVRIELEDRLRKGLFWGPVERPLLRWTIGYGYDPIRAFWWAAGLGALGWVIYRRSYLAGAIAPTEEKTYDEFKKVGGIPAHYPKFSPLIYSVENSLPLVKLGQGDKWQPDPERDVATRQRRPATEFGYRAKWDWLPAKLQTGWPALCRRLDQARSRIPGRLRDSWRWFSGKTTAPRFVMWFLWFQILLGWLLATLFIAGLSGVVHKE